MAEAKSYQPSFLERRLIGTFKFINRFISWDKLPGFIGVFNLLAFRIELREKNLYDGYPSASAQGDNAKDTMPDSRFKGARNSDGKYNSLEMPLMGASGMRFGRNFPKQLCQRPSEEELWHPSPRMLSEKFMARSKFKPAATLNLLAAAWIQFQIHDWVNHEMGDETFDIPLPSGDKWPAGHMTLPKSVPDEVLDPIELKCPAYKNTNTHWWDSSQLYGSTEEITAEIRTKHPDGKLILRDDGREEYLKRDENGLPLTGFNLNWWIGLEILHTLFAMEHNAVCDKLRKTYPNWAGEIIFDKARLVVCALIAKIHTVEWTPAILGHPALQIGMNANWWGLMGESLTKILGNFSKNEVIGGIPGSGVDQDGVPYALTEEFISVYRLHTLIPDNIAFFDADDGAHKSTIPIGDLAFQHAQEPLDKNVTFADAFYSFGINYPGAITHNNYPEFMRNLPTPDGYVRDMATVDILRDRERGIPRYTQFRRLLHMTVPKTFEELTGGDKELAKQLRDVYDDNIDLVDNIIGCQCEPLPKGFGFSDTQFRIFILMASRRIKSDRFLAAQFDKTTYTPEGFNWVQNTTMKDVLIRHFPELKETLKGSKNAFAPWTKKPKSGQYKGPETNA